MLAHGSRPGRALSLPLGCASANRPRRLRPAQELCAAHCRLVRSRRAFQAPCCAARPQLLSALRRAGVLRPLLDLLPLRGWADLEAVETRPATYGRCAAATVSLRCVSKLLTPSIAASLHYAPCVLASLWASTLG